MAAGFFAVITRRVFVIITHCSVEQIRNFLSRSFVDQGHDHGAYQTRDKTREQLVNTGGIRQEVEPQNVHDRTTQYTCDRAFVCKSSPEERQQDHRSEGRAEACCTRTRTAAEPAGPEPAARAASAAESAPFRA